MESAQCTELTSSTYSTLDQFQTVLLSEEATRLAHSTDTPFGSALYAKDSILCNYCGKKNHLERDCFKKKNANAGTGTVAGTDAGGANFGYGRHGCGGHGYGRDCGCGQGKSSFILSQIKENTNQIESKLTKHISKNKKRKIKFKNKLNESLSVSDKAGKACNPATPTDTGLQKGKAGNLATPTDTSLQKGNASNSATLIEQADLSAAQTGDLGSREGR